MCGIAGIRKYGKEPIQEIQLRMLMLGLEHRGNDASGMALQNKEGKIFVLKNDVPAWTFVRSKEYEDFINENLTADTIQAIVHTRAATKGNPRKAINNHPLTAGVSAVIHNGKVHNDDQIFRELGLERHADTDSDIFRAIVDKYGITRAAIERLNKCRGGAAIAAFHPDYPGQMLLGRSGNPLTQAVDDDYFVFASEKNIIHKAMRPYVYKHKKWFQKQALNLAFSPYPNDTIEIMGPEGQEWHEEFKIHFGDYHEPIRRVYSEYAERQRKFDEDFEREKRQAEERKKTWSNEHIVVRGRWAQAEEAERSEAPATVDPSVQPRVLVECPNPACKHRWALKPEQVTMPRYNLICDISRGGCGGRLGQFGVPAPNLVIH